MGDERDWVCAKSSPNHLRFSDTLKNTILCGDIAQCTDHVPFLTRSSTFLRRFLSYRVVLSDQKVSGSSEDSYRKLRLDTFKSWSLLKMCWPFEKNIVSNKICVIAKCIYLDSGKKHFLIFTKICVRNHNVSSLYRRKWKF